MIKSFTKIINYFGFFLLVCLLMSAPKVEAKPQVKKMTPVASKPAPQKAVAPTPKVEAKPVETFKPKTESSSKKGIDAALDGLE